MAVFRVAVAVLAVACVATAVGGVESRRVKQQRPTRGFKNVEMMTARGFGKRDHPQSRAEPLFDSPRRRFKPKTSLMVASDFGKRAASQLEDTASTDEVYGLDNFWEMLESSPEKENSVNEEKPLESITLNWFVNEMLNNPEFARSVVRKFIDLNQDGMLSSDELLRNV